MDGIVTKADTDFPLTDLQSAYLVGASPLMELGGFRPNLYFELDMVAFDPARAEQAVNRLIRRHEILRTVVRPEGTQSVHQPGETPPFRIPVQDLTGMDRQAREKALTRVREQLRDNGPSPTGWPLFQVVAQQLRRHRTRVHCAMSLLLLDSHSTQILLDEWRELYNDPSVELPPVRGSFRDRVLAFAAYEETDEYKEHWRYWEERIESLPEAPALPLARRPASLTAVKMTRRTCRLTADQWERLRTNFRRHRTLPTTALLHVFAETLGAWATAPRFCLNVLHRNWVSRHPAAEGVVGQFSSTLPLEVDLTGDEDFWSRAGRLQRRLWRDLKHADVTGVRVTRELAARHGWSQQAALPYVFNSMLGPGQADEAVARPGCRTVTSALRTPQVLIDNQVKDSPEGGIECVWDVVDDAYPPGLPDTMFAAYRSLLEALASEGGALSAPDPVPSAHRERVTALNAPPASLPVGRLEDGFLRSARRTPQAPAVVTRLHTLSYEDVERRSRAVALWLRERGVSPGHTVPVVMRKGWEQVVAVLGVLRAGAAYCPVDSALPQERIEHLLKMCGAPVVLVQSTNLPEGAARPAGGILAVDRTAPAAAALPHHGGSAEDLAYTIYTSGSTGLPKGVMMEHRAAVNTVVDVGKRAGLNADDRVLQISSLSFDLSVWDIFGTLAAGAALVVPEATAHPDPQGWAALAAAEGVTLWNSVPALAEMLVELAAEQEAYRHPPIRAFLLSGDWIAPSLPTRIRTLWPQARVIAMGGATEAAIWSNVHEVREVDPSWRSVPYGTPLSGQTMRVLDHRLGLRPPWATGGIYIGGAGLARGYAGDEERTRERFIRNLETGERLYRTGDRGRYWPDGTIEFLGREDRQVQIQGFRVEPGEVEVALRGHPAVAECVVCAMATPGGQQRLVSLVVAEDGAEADPAELAGHLRARLPAYMVPTQIQCVGELPLSANGKVDGSRVPELLHSAAAEAEPPEADDPTVAHLTGLWRDLLQAPTAGPDSDFFDLGGNSLLALRLVNRIRTDSGTELRFGQIFETPTPRRLAHFVRHRVGSGQSMVTLSDASGRELFLFHPVGGSVSSYREFARAWPGPVRAFQAQSLVQGSAPEPGQDVRAMAAAYVAELRRHAPAGPYLLGGWSMGGLLAHEAAQHLAGQGDTCTVFMFDSVPYERRHTGAERDRHLEFLKDLAGGRLSPDVAAAVSGAPEGDLTRTAMRSAVHGGLLPEETDLQQYELLMRTHAHNLAVLKEHVPRESDLPTLLFLAADEDRDGATAAWRRLCTRIDIQPLRCDHYGIVEPDRLAATAERLQEWLAEERTG